MRFHAPLLPMAACLTAGIMMSECNVTLLQNEWMPDWSVGLMLLIPMVVITILSGRLPRLQTVAICCCTLLLGLTLGARSRKLLDVAWPQGRLLADVVVVSEPVLKESSVIFDVLTTEGHYKMRCRMARNERSERVGLGNGLRLHTYIRKIHPWRQGHFDYRRYMQCHGYAGEMTVGDGQWQWYSHPLSGLSYIERARLRFLGWRHTLLEHFRQWGLDDEVYGIVSAITLGERSQLDSQLRDTYSRAGASHVLALSGLHLMIIYAVISLFFGWRRFRIVSQIITVVAIWAFAFLVGLSPSVVRSAFMISLYALLSLGHRERMSINTLAFAAIVMLVVNPLILDDMGFQLSFLSVLGILLFCPLIELFLPAHVMQRHRVLRSLAGMASVSAAAQVGTAPLVAFYFERFANLFLLTNFFVIPLTTLILYLTLAIVTTGWWSSLQTLLAGGLSAVVTLMNYLMEAVTRLPFSSTEGIHLSLLQLVLAYVVTGSVYCLLRIWAKGKR